MQTASPVWYEKRRMLVLLPCLSASIGQTGSRGDVLKTLVKSGKCAGDRCGCTYGFDCHWILSARCPIHDAACWKFVIQVALLVGLLRPIITTDWPRLTNQPSGFCLIMKPFRQWMKYVNHAWKHIRMNSVSVKLCACCKSIWVGEGTQHSVGTHLTQHIQLRVARCRNGKTYVHADGSASGGSLKQVSVSSCAQLWAAFHFEWNATKGWRVKNLWLLRDWFVFWHSNFCMLWEG